MKRIKKLICIMLSISVIFALTALVWAGETEWSGAEASEIIDVIGGLVAAHRDHIQSESKELLAYEPEALAALDFAECDTSRIELGTELYAFNDAMPSVISHMTKGNAEDAVSGKGDEVVTFEHGSCDVHSILGLGGYPQLFADNTVLRAASGSRVKLIKAYPENVPDYQVVQYRKNIYVENIDFSGFDTIKFEYCDNIIFNNCTFNDFSANGLVFRGCSNVAVINCSFKNCGNQMSDFTNGGYSIRVIGMADYPAEGILIENCTIDNSCGHAVSLLDKVDNFVIRNNTVTNSVWSAIHFWRPDISGNYVNVIENNECVNVGFGKPSPNDSDASSGVGCSAIYASRGSELSKTVVKNNTVSNAVENGIEGSYELVYHNKIKNTGENSVMRYTTSTEGIYILPTCGIEQKCVANDIETRGVRCISMYSNEDKEYKAIYIIGNSLNLKETDATIVNKHSRSDIEINCLKIKKLVIRGNMGMRENETSVNVYVDKSYTMDWFDLENRCKIGDIPSAAKYCYNINTL